MITPLITANQAISSNVRAVAPVSFGSLREGEDGSEAQTTNPINVPQPSTQTNYFENNEKLNIKFTGAREYSLNGNKVDYFA